MDIAMRLSCRCLQSPGACRQAAGCCFVRRIEDGCAAHCAGVFVLGDYVTVTLTGGQTYASPQGFSMNRIANIIRGPASGSSPVVTCSQPGCTAITLAQTAVKLQNVTVLGGAPGVSVAADSILVRSSSSWCCVTLTQGSQKCDFNLA